MSGFTRSAGRSRLKYKKGFTSFYNEMSFRKDNLIIIISLHPGKGVSKMTYKNVRALRKQGARD